MKISEYWWSKSFLEFVFCRFCMFCASTMPWYHVSVYRTIGPLVLNMKPSKGEKKVTWSFLNLRLSSFTSDILGSTLPGGKGLGLQIQRSSYTQEAVAPSQHDWKNVYRDVKNHANQHLKFKISVSQKPLCHFYQILYVSSYVHWNENLLTRCWKHDQDGFGIFRTPITKVITCMEI